MMAGKGGKEKERRTDRQSFNEREKGFTSVITGTAEAR